MKNILIFSCIFLITPLFGQIYMRTKKNIGFYANLNQRTEANKLNSFGVGFTRQFGSYILPEIGYRQQVEPFDRTMTQTGIKSHFIQTGITFRKKILKINERKVGRSCQAELIEIFVTPELFGRIPNQTSDFNYNPSIRAGLGIYHVQTGFGRFNKMFQLKVEGYYRHSFGENPIVPNELGIQLRILKHKIIDFTK